MSTRGHHRQEGILLAHRYFCAGTDTIAMTVAVGPPSECGLTA